MINQPSSFFLHYFLLLLAAFLTIQGCSQKRGPQAPPPPTVTVSTPLQDSIMIWDEYIGRFEAIERVEVRARVSGYLDKINFKDGQMVEKGDVIFVIDQRPFKVALEEAEANLANVDTRLELAKKEFNRIDGLQHTGAVSQEEYDRRRQELLSAEAAYGSARAAVNAAELDLEFTEVKAPVSGKISQRFISIGNYISGGSGDGTLLTRIVSMDPIYYSFEASEEQLLGYLRSERLGEGKLKLTDPRPIYVKLLDENTFVHQGELNFIDNAVDRSTGTLLGRATFENNDGLLLPGMFGRARFSVEGKQSRLLIPDEIIGSDQANKFVFVVDDSSKVKRKMVETGDLKNQLRIVESGLNKNEKVVINGMAKIRAGIKVNVTEGAISKSTEEN